MGGVLNAAICDGVQKGICVVIVDKQIVYAGPIGAAPRPMDDKLVLLNAEDFEKLKVVVDRHKN